MKRFALALGSILVLFLLFEGTLRVREAGKRREILADRAVEDLGTVRADPPLLYCLKPGWRGIFNSAGFRDVERSPGKANNVFRLAVVGDSVTMKLSIPFEQLYVRQLEKLLRNETDNRRIECLSFGVTGYCAAQELALVQGRVLDFEPDAILWQFHLNDAADPLIDGANGGLARYYARPRSQVVFHFRRKIDRILKERYLRRRFPGLKQRDLQLQAWHWDEMGRVIFEMRELSAARGVPVHVVVYPSWPDDGDWESFTEADNRLYNAMVDRFTETGFETLDLMPVFKQWPVSDLQREPGDLWHPNAKGHRIMAEAIARWLIDDGVLENQAGLINSNPPM
jgi:lysophospholipase L1-like esterase